MNYLLVILIAFLILLCIWYAAFKYKQAITLRYIDRMQKQALITKEQRKAEYAKLNGPVPYNHRRGSCKP